MSHMEEYLDKPEKTIVAVVGIVCFLVLAVLLVARLLGSPSSDLFVTTAGTDRGGPVNSPITQGFR